jgi:hypothetical protein
MNVDLQYLDFQIPIFFEWKEGVKFKIVTKGRRTGITRGSANACIEYLIDGTAPVLWGDTIHANIDKYFTRYFLPELKRNNIKHQWESQKKQLTINGNVCDFRSADNPENWEGFGYKVIILNEAGIILKNKDLYTNTVLPMLLDFPDSKLIAAGVPKGKFLKNGLEHPFYTLAKRAMDGNPKYELVALTSYDNPVLKANDIRELEIEIAAMSDSAVDQEIYGKFIDFDATNPFAHAFSVDYHVSEKAIFQPNRKVYISIDFNLNPFAVTFSHIWKDQDGLHDHTFMESSIDNGSVQAMATRIKEILGRSLSNVAITGDALGNNRNINQADNASNYQMLRRLLNLPDSVFKVRNNPTHDKSRNDTNYVLSAARQPEFRFEKLIHPRNCPGTVSDYKIVQCDAFGEIIKHNRNDLAQRADFLDTERYKIHYFIFPEIDRIAKSLGLNRK